MMQEDELTIIYNAIQTPDGTTLESFSVHDYKTHLDANGEEYMVDGGLAYIKRSVNVAPFKELTIKSDAPHSVQRKYWRWGTFGINGDQPLTYVKLENMDYNHIAAILCTQRITNARRKAYMKELFHRNNLCAQAS